MSAAAARGPGPRPLAPAARRLLLAAAGRLRRRGAEGRGHRHGRLRPLVAALLRGRPRERPLGAVPGAEPQQALDPPGPQAGAAAARRCCALVREHDVVLESFRPGVLDRLGVGYERMREVNPGIVFCAITGYGQDGPKRDASGHDMNYLGLIGLLGPDGRARGRAGAGRRPDRRPRRRGPDGRLRDHGGAARARRRRPGARARARASSWTCRWPTAPCRGWRWWRRRYFADGNVPRRGDLPLAGSLICYRPYECADGWVLAGGAGAEVLAGLLPRGGPRGPDRQRSSRGPARQAHAQVEEIFTRAHPRASGRPSPASTTAAWSRCSSSTRRSPPSWCAAREMVVEIDQPGAERPGPPARAAGEADPHPRRARAAARARRSASTPRRCCAPAGYSEAEVAGAAAQRRRRRPGPASQLTTLRA